MNIIPIKSAEDSNCWLKISDPYNSNEGFMKIRLMEFRKVSIKEIDNPENISKQYNLSDGNIFLLKLDVVNFYKEELMLSSAIIIVDQDNFKFNPIQDDHISLHSNFAEKSGLKNFYGTYLKPKIKYTGAITYFLPIDDEAEYFVTDGAGTICEL